ncbi:hypothetical protein ACVWY1_004431 [Pseudomonas sp. TE6288]|uniref:DUF1090 domain-containing protein n=1 Tax=Pseudomonas TaxID=286 RepID=UPI000C8881FB|nr:MULTISPECIES: DUF1090 domain-containing protein [Pseudomonas]MDF9753783.1 hypothetical protein [Pseudomonas hunanensis]PNA01704.1 DUF1090 domain-containing protein [Pseudomonas sp. FW305-42]PNA25655.1 DUF1090 domain-containing protein [Pseudomonas sp. MPR-R1B]PNB27178.1 DUF1090 domain-containing protein [Pseudomonas sp. DP16D-E2]PNB44564.1 DUF1090 domain-containing protein [Pseudomonas sp. FW305-17]
MTRFTALFLLATLGLATGAAQAAQPDAGLTGCAAKRSAIENQLKIARDHGNSNQAAGLEEALRGVDNCTEAGLRKEREQKVLDARHEVNQRTKDLDKAMKKGDAEKINKRKDKLAEAKKELQEAVDELER